jgi:hypothetical protein
MSEWAVLRRHALPNAFIPVVPMAALDISRFALPTALFVETAFGLPGLGQTLRNALIRNDLPVIVGVVAVTALVIAIVNFAGEVIQALIDPRVKLEPASASRARERTGARSSCAAALRPRSLAPLRPRTGSRSAARARRDRRH